MFTRKRFISRVRVLPPGNPTNNYPPSLQLPRSQHGARSRRRGVTIPRGVTQLGPQYGQYSDGDTRGQRVTWHLPLPSRSCVQQK